jgi:hypothetical protein
MAPFDTSRLTVESPSTVPAAQLVLRAERALSPVSELFDVEAETVDGRRIRETHEVDLFTGLSRIHMTTEPRPVFSLQMSLRDREPWWKLSVDPDPDEDKPYPSEGSIFSVTFSATGGELKPFQFPCPEPDDPPIYAAYLRTVAAFLKHQLEHVFREQTPKPVTVAAYAVVKRIPIFDAAVALRRERTKEVGLYIGRLVDFVNRHVNAVVNDAVASLFDEATASARLALNGAEDRRPAVAAAIEAKAGASARARLGLKPGRPKGSGTFKTELDFVEALIETILESLRKRPKRSVDPKTIGEAAIEKKLAGKVGISASKGRFLRRYFERYGLDWDEIRAQAVNVYDANIYIASKAGNNMHPLLSTRSSNSCLSN